MGYSEEMGGVEVERKESRRGKGDREDNRGKSREGEVGKKREEIRIPNSSISSLFWLVLSIE